MVAIEDDDEDDEDLRFSILDKSEKFVILMSKL